MKLTNFVSVVNKRACLYEFENLTKFIITGRDNYIIYIKMHLQSLFLFSNRNITEYFYFCFAFHYLKMSKFSTDCNFSRDINKYISLVTVGKKRNLGFSFTPTTYHTIYWREGRYFLNQFAVSYVIYDSPNLL